MNIDLLLQPLTPEAPCGADLSFSAEFDAVQEMRRADDPTLPQGEWVTELKSADWPGVATACETLLAARTKDLRVVGWLAEAWAHLRGYGGLADGVALAQGLCEQQWAALHPRPDGADFELRVGALSRLLAQVCALALVLPVLRRGEHRYSLRDMEAARALQAALAKASDPAAVATAGKVMPEQVQKAQRETPPAAIAECLAHCLRARAALHGLQAVVDGHLGAEGPAFSAAKGVLDTAVHALERLAREAGVPGAASGAAADESSAAAGGDGQAGALGGAPGSRAQALAQLRLVAEFFRRTEPHSPVAYLAERAAQWGEMPLHEWLRRVMKDAGALGHLEELLGVEPPNSNDSNDSKG